jgi:proteasome lid subunit RPN8/RPN11
MVILDPHIKKLLLNNAQQAFPDECYGFLFGTDEGELRVLSDILAINTAKETDKRRRLEFAPRDYQLAEQYALEKNLSLLSVYHSHPNHPPIMSDHDRIIAKPFLSYIIVSVYERGRINMLSWRLNDSQWFVREEILEHTLI